uniref:Reverse transcriptase zinc-binding domain-containing protein n=1 Tax=Chenopodium quinoa TaxID=63459 RepID=A0A803LLA5_CHEQI
MWGAKGLLRDGLAWRVGDGNSIRTWKDPWVMQEGKPLMLTMPMGADENMLVRELFLDGGREWDPAKVCSLVGEDIRAKILATPLPFSRQGDGVFWWQAKAGLYSVRSGYWLAKGGEGSELAGMPEDEVWKMVWRTRGPPKLLHFLWNAVKGNLAVKSRLVQRHIINEASCQICGHHVETIWHALVECDAAAAIWEHSELKSNLTDAP